MSPAFPSGFAGVYLRDVSEGDLRTDCPDKECVFLRPASCQCDAITARTSAAPAVELSLSDVSSGLTQGAREKDALHRGIVEVSVIVGTERSLVLQYSGPTGRWQCDTGVENMAKNAN